MKNTRILLTGASGFLGGELFNLLSTTNEVTGICHRPDARFRAVDLREPAQIKKLLDDVQPDVVIHSAAYRKPDECEQHPEACRRLNVQPLETFRNCFPMPGKLVFVSTDYVFDGRNPPYTEDDPCCAVNVYGQSKVDAETIVRQRKNSVIVRVPLLVGTEPEEDGHLSALYRQIKSGEECQIDHCGIRHPTWACDAARAIAFLLEKDATGIFHYCNPETLTKYEMAVSVANTLGLPHDHIKPLLKPLPITAPRPVDSSLDCTKINELGFTHTMPFAEVVRLCAPDFR
ncbi:MAG: SDR family oxidoreductase [Kiritimatiellales bacterium]|nr:SDR family oxidoreductase [Kiritimatiellales bacterium]